MVGLNKFTEKERRKARRSFQSNKIHEDLITPKYRERTIPDKRKKNPDGSFMRDADYHDFMYEDEDEEDSDLRG